MDCKICDKVFTGIASYEQHKASKKHKSKVLQYEQLNPKMKTAIKDQSNLKYQSKESIPCNICNITCYSLSEFITHTSSESHVCMVLKNKKSAVECDSTVKPDNEALSNNTEQEMHPEHINNLDDKENKVISNFLAAEIPKTTFNGVYAYSCDVCVKTFSGYVCYKQHIDGVKHKNKLVASNSGPLKCDICKVMLSGQLNYDQHMSGENHRKTVAKCSFMSSLDNKMDTISECNMALSCNICDMKFTGPSCYEQHLKGETHRKKVANNSSINLNNRMETDSNPAASHARSSGLQPSQFYCEVCSLFCSGLIPYNEHLGSKGHRKKSMDNQAASKRKEIQNLTSPVREKENSINNLKPNSEYSQLNNLSCDIKKSIDKSLDLNLQSVQPSNLNITFFNVGEPIDFDKTSKNNIEIDLVSDSDEDSLEDYKDINYN